MRLRGNPRLKRLDRYLGIPLVRAVSLFSKRRQPDLGSLRRIGLLKSAAIGDTLLLAGPIDDVRRAHPTAELVLITGEDNRGAGELLAPRVDRHITISPRHPVAAARTLRRERFDALLDFGAWPRFDALITALSGARLRAGFETHGQSRHYAYDVVVQHSSAVHEIENYRRLVWTLGARDGAAPRLEPRGLVDGARLPTPPYVILHPWSGGYRGDRKEWSSSHWVELGIELNKQGWTMVITGSDADVERARVIELALGGFGCTAINAAGAYTLVELTDLLAGSEAVITVNTGVMHLAAMLGAVTVSLEGPTPVHRWGPLGPRASSVVTPTPECGFLDLGFEYAGQREDCMEGITVQAVAAAVLQAVGAAGRQVTR